MLLSRFRWWIWNKCYDWDMKVPSLIGDNLVWFADTFCNLTSEEMKILDIADGITDEEFEKYFENFCAGSPKNYDDEGEYTLFDIDTDEYWGK